MYRILLLGIAIFLFINCSAQDNLTKEEKEWLIKKTKESLVFVPGGTFWMGDVGYTDENGEHRLFTNDPDCLPVHKVTLDSFSIMKYEVTFGEFDLFSKAKGSELLCLKYKDEEYRKPNYPAFYMTWYQAQEYCEWVGNLIGYPMGLPTEAQWEYAARSRGKAVSHGTDNGKIEWNRNYAGEEYPWYGTPPGTFPPNPLGLYDMSGNLAEWTYDWNYIYTESPQINPSGPDTGLVKIVRGFSTGLPGSIYFRGKREPTRTGSGIATRCVSNYKQPVK